MGYTVSSSQAFVCLRIFFVPKLTHKKLLRSLKKRISRLARQYPLLADITEIGSIRSGNKLSRLFRHIIEHTNIKAILGGNITLMIITTGLLVPGGVAGDTPAETLVLPAIPTQVLTEVKVRYPIENVRINQGYSYFHWGVDLGAPSGSPIFPIEKGVVESREFSRFGYGNSIVVDHKDGLKSRYAHLSRIDAREGDEVGTDTVIGKVGSTGHSTGPHLHLEIYENGRPINPAILLGRLSR